MGDYMLFNSFEFILIFFPLALLGYFLLNRLSMFTLGKAWLVVASLFFYSYFKFEYFFIISASILVNYGLSRLIYLLKEKIFYKKLVLSIGLIFNIAIIGYFKYTDFGIEIINSLFGTDIQLLNVLLPLGISFFTFQQVAFLIDSYRETVKLFSFIDYALFISFFPQLIAGPIVLANEMMPQFEEPEKKRFNFDNAAKGLYIFSIGLAKKIIIADSVALFANVGFSMAELNFCEAWLTSIAYTVQLYFDFSGYCDMAIGIGLFFNIKLPVNFNSPLKSTSIQDFWRRWHMTLGRFFNLYLYRPLGGSKKGQLLTIRNLLIVFLFSAVWHGAGWNFIIWGMLHGFGILIYKFYRYCCGDKFKLNKYIAIAVTFLFVNITFVFFRSPELGGAIEILKALFDFKSIPVGLSDSYDFAMWAPTWGEGFTYQMIILMASLVLIFFAKNSSEQLEKFKYSAWNILQIIIYFLVSFLLINRLVNFLYFNF